ncbi:DUF2244 domain-containing protein [Pigmentiphaga litoralis]|uniref:Putative membrane protein n=1 Tax=Pigmentiphaga litoralis TaxID=516702 RepID=A0A7Y9IW87_9BURK|nr:DUF2244 domain-containing protein [Pigmentiphaga litoralis]NYE22256.1 putative membrane protein [Pigmentiphaga litoralis]NYE84129.1 putative membrane protein [Pigmentiphaga litoralis]
MPPSPLSQARVERSWTLRRNCCVSPGQCLAGIASLDGVLAILGAGALAYGLWVITLFCLVDVLAVSLAGLCYMRHARDGETLSLMDDGSVVVEAERGGNSTRQVFNRNWVHVDLERTSDPQSATLWLRQGATRMRIGEFVPRHRLGALQRDLRRALPWDGAAHGAPSSALQSLTTT